MRVDEIDEIIRKCEIIEEWFNENSDGDYPVTVPNVLILIRDLKKAEQLKEYENNGKK